MECPICSRDKFIVIDKMKNNKILLCKSCSLAFLKKKPDDISHKKYYQKNYRKSTRGKSEIDNEIKKYENNRAKNILKFLKQNSANILDLHSILDIGCSTGSLLELLGDWKDSELRMGIELNEDYVHYINNNHKNISIIGHNLEEFDSTEYKGRFDMISIVHVLEHLRDPNAIMKKIKSMLKDGGLLYLEVPNLLTPYAKLWSQYFSHYHLFYFNSLNLKLFLEKEGFKIIAKNRPGKISIGYLCKYDVLKSEKQEDISLSFFNHSWFQRIALFVYQIKYYLIIILKFILKKLHVKRFRA